MESSSDAVTKVHPNLIGLMSLQEEGHRDARGECHVTQRKKLEWYSWKITNAKD